MSPVELYSRDEAGSAEQSVRGGQPVRLDDYLRSPEDSIGEGGFGMRIHFPARILGLFIMSYRLRGGR